MQLDPQKTMILVSGISWLAVSLWPVLRGRIALPPDLSFFLFASLIGAWALIDYVFLTSQDLAFALLLSKVRITVFTVGILFLLYWAKWTTAGRVGVDILFLVPTAFSLYLIWTSITYDIEMQPWGPRLLRDPFYYALWTGQIICYVLLSSYYLLRNIRAVIVTDRHNGLRVAVTIASLFAILGIWSVTNMYNNLTRSTNFPYLSSLLWIPAAMILVMLAPVPGEKLWRLWQNVALTWDRKVMAACLLDSEGQILGVAAASTRDLARFKGMEDIMRVIDDYMAKAVQAGTRRLRSVVVGNVTFIVENRGGLILVLAIEGSYSDILRKEVQDTLELLQSENLAESVRQTSEVAKPTLEAMLQRLVAPPPPH
jgi:hypothetical protein